MKANATLAQRLGRFLERLTQTSGRLPETSSYGSWLLGHVAEGPRRRRIRIQLILTVFILVTNLVGMGVSILLVTVAFPDPSVFDDAPAWLTYGVAPAYLTLALGVGTIWITRATVNALRWAVEDSPPTADNMRQAFLAPWRVATAHLALWGTGTVIFAVLYGIYDTLFIPRFLIAVGICGVMVATFAYLFTEFALRPVAARALEAGDPPKRLAPGIMGRIMTVWTVGAGIPVIGIGLIALFVLLLRNLTQTQFAVAVLISAAATVIFGFVLMWVAAWITATPVRVVRAALKRVEEGKLDTNLVVFDGTELGQLQRGFNSMVAGLRERERVRDLFGRHVGREVAAAAEARQVDLGGEERHAAVLFVDIVGSTTLVTSRAATEVVALLNRFFTVVVDEVNEHDGLLNKFEGDGCLAVFGAPNDLDSPEDAALATARGIAARLRVEVPGIEAGIGVAAGTVVAGNVGAHDRFEYTVIGAPVNEAARLCELAKNSPGCLLASSDTVRGATESERALWTFGDTVTLRGYEVPTLLAMPR
ncbi:MULTISPECIES: adenylate/guanylate cyclase domain-containing protein [Mycolicibacterium]|uniref:Family 3 adenylate cyclase n=1 Tax=Mycolicibacterium chitae TaxID=1792 RepID=A0A3S4RF39_MYCCI|nr:adenylate/guanylate cyclase domain-containing protein [Mycolicibacterium chitae]MCV7104843.1 HAMP domain-containing protein [Mycolicibacterium chitae]VEG46861.1 family 3 adenylate cyclase [Mycolicibacterium chitae]